MVYAVKLYPAGATTNSQDGVTDLFGKCLPVLQEMVEQNMPLLVSCEKMQDFKVPFWSSNLIFVFYLIYGVFLSETSSYLPIAAFSNINSLAS